MKKLLSLELGFAGFFHLFGTHVAGKYFFGAYVTSVGRTARALFKEGTAGEQQGGCDQYGIKSKFFHGRGTINKDEGRSKSLVRSSPY